MVVLLKVDKLKYVEFDTDTALATINRIVKRAENDGRGIRIAVGDQ